MAYGHHRPWRIEIDCILGLLKDRTPLAVGAYRPRKGITGAITG